MKKMTAILIAVSFLGMALFGFSGMHMAQEGPGHAGCAAAVLNGTECPHDNDLFSFVVFHIKAFKSFSVATPGWFFVAAVLILVIYRTPIPLCASNHVSKRVRQSRLLFISSRQKFIRRLSLYENSPSFNLGIEMNP